jgi:hypothetical protein
MYLTALTLITLIILIIPFITFYKKSNKRDNKKFILLLLSYFICAGPMLYAVIDHKIVQYEDANIGLGIAFFITWILTVFVYLVLLGYLMKNKRN